MIGGLIVAVRGAALQQAAASRAAPDPRHERRSSAASARASAGLAPLVFVFGVVITESAQRGRGDRPDGLATAQTQPRPARRRRRAARDQGLRPAVAVALRVPGRHLQLLRDGRSGRHRGRPQPRLDRRPAPLVGAGARRHVRRAPGLRQPDLVQGRRGRHLRGPLDPVLRPRLRRDARPRHGRRARPSTRPGSPSRRVIEDAQDTRQAAVLQARPTSSDDEHAATGSRKAETETAITGRCRSDGGS